MAEKVLKTRIQLKYDTYENWKLNNPVLKTGEMAIATLNPAKDGKPADGIVPAVLIKVGDNSTPYNGLPFASGLAADVYAWAKKEKLALEDLPELNAKDIKNLDTYLQGKGYALDSDLTALENKVGVLPEGSANVIAYVDKKTEGIASNEALTTLAGKVTTNTDAIEVLNGIASVPGSVAEAKKAGENAAAAVDVKLTSEVNRAQKAEEGIATNAAAIATLNGGVEVVGSVAHAVAAEAKIARAAEQANAAALETYKTSNDKAVKAIADDYLTSADKTALTMSMSTKEQGEANVYTFQQGSSPAFTINIPKEMVVESGTVKEVAEINVPYEGAQVGDKYIDLVLNNKNHVYVPAKDLVDVYTGVEGTNINITVDQSKNEISAVLNANSVTNAQLAGNIAEEKLDASLKAKLGKIATNESAISNIETKLGNGTLVADKANKATGDEDGLNIKNNYALKSELHTHANKEELDKIAIGDKAKWDTAAGKANSAVQKVIEGTANGTIKVDSTDINVHGLKSAAYTESSEYATSAQGALADSALQTASEGLKVAGKDVQIDSSVVFVFNCGSATENIA